ncbi:MAG: helix-turn-helix domain-containing protein [Anaerolineales bacterium]|nr:helix-turn-helix domain-containing protein [Anaerolineales bacterium]
MTVEESLDFDVLTTSQAARYCGVSPETIRRWIRTKGLQAFNTQLGLNIRIRRADLEAFARQHNILLQRPATAEPAAGTPPMEA